MGIKVRQFALHEGFPLEEKKLSEHADKSYADWLRRSEYSPEINIEPNKHKITPVPDTLESGFDYTVSRSDLPHEIRAIKALLD